MTRRLISGGIAALLVFATIACGKKEPTPTEVFKSYYEASKSRKPDAISDLLSRETMGNVAKKSGSLQISINEVILRQTEGVPETLPATRNEKIDGDKATLEFNIKRGETESWQTISFVKEDGKWKVLWK